MSSATGKAKTKSAASAKGKGKGKSKGTAADAAKKIKRDDPIEEFFSRFEKVKLKDMVIFSRQFASMIGSGVAMIRTLTIISEQCENKKLKEVLSDVKAQVENGAALSDAFSRHPDTFDRLFVSMVKAGETGGILDEVMKKVAEFAEQRQKLNDKVKSAMAYPTVALAVAVIVFWVMLTFIIPVFKSMFDGMGSELPAFTQMLINLSTIMRSVWMLVVVAVLGGAFYATKQYYKTEPGRYAIDGMMLKLPVVGDVIQKVAVARFTRTFGVLVRSGVPMLTALDVVKETAGNAVLSKAVESVQREVREGGSISKPLSKEPLFPPMVVQMVAVGEETGKLDDMLSKIADFYDDEVENSVDALTSVLEPIMVVFIGGIVGSVVVGMYLPIFSIINQIK
ncbi:MAG TPA: type II secretion system F family protein [Candidatus Obscuribacterales bacterium]